MLPELDIDHLTCGQIRSISPKLEPTLLLEPIEDPDFTAHIATTI